MCVMAQGEQFSTATLQEGGCQRRWGSWIPNALHPSPLMFLQKRFNTTTNAETAETTLY